MEKTISNRGPLSLVGDASALLHQAVTLLEQVASKDRFAVGLASCYHQAGTSSVAWHFARALAANGRQSVCLVEANIRTPVLANALGLRLAPGLRELLTGGVDVEAAVQHMDARAISVITSGLDRAADATVVSRDALGTVVDRLRARFQVVVFDAAPLLPYLESITLAQQLDGMVLVLRAESDKREVAQQTVQMLERAGARVLGAVLNRKPLHIPQWIYKLL